MRPYAKELGKVLFAISCVNVVFSGFLGPIPICLTALLMGATQENEILDPRWRVRLFKHLASLFFHHSLSPSASNCDIAKTSVLLTCVPSSMRKCRFASI